MDAPPSGKSNRLASPRVLIAGGGTGGHLFPALAIAEALLEQAPEATVRFAGSRYGLEHRVIPERGYKLYRIPVRGLYGVSWPRRLWVLAMLPLAFLKCVWILLRWRPHLVMGVGGYASGPILATALLLRFRCVIQEQNTVPGLTNRLLGRFVRMAFTATEDVGDTGNPGHTQKWFRKTLVTGNPVRKAILALREQAAQQQPPREPPLVLVVGGSQGARVLNRVMGDTLTALRAGGRDLRILHQSGPRELETVREVYAAAGVRSEGEGLTAEVQAFIEDMATVYRQARVIVSRAGASAVSEIIVARRASVLVPIPGTSGEHQLRNAQRLAQAGAALLIEQRDLNGEGLARTLLELLDDPARLDAMEAATDALFKGDAATLIAAACLEMIGGR